MTGKNQTHGNYACFSHRTCEYYPCHRGADPEHFNCLFCHCPLYPLGTDCGGAFTLLPDGTKDCSLCLLPHRPENYDRVLEGLALLRARTARSFPGETDAEGKD